MKNENALFECSKCGESLGLKGQAHLNNTPDGEQSWSCGKTQHTPTIDADALMTCLLGIGYLPERAAFIVRAVNSHEELIESLKMAIEMIESMNRGPKPLGKFRQAIAKAEGTNTAEGRK